MTVYWDLMFLINFFTDYLILYISSKVNFFNTGFFKLLLGAFIGGVYGIFLFETNLIINIISYILVTFLILKIVFKKPDFKIISVYYTVSFIFGGLGSFFNNIYGVVKVSEGFLYVENNLWAVLISFIISSVAVITVLKLTKRNIIKGRQLQMFDIYLEEKKVSVTGLLDTGNLLLDPITGYPVIVVMYDTVKEIIPEELNKFLSEGNDLSYNISRKYLKKIRLIPCKNSISNDILKGFKPDYVVIDDSKKKIVKDVIIAVVYNKLSENNEFGAILNPQI